MKERNKGRGAEGSARRRRESRSGSAEGLDARQVEVLRAIARRHILSGEPVGSSAVSREARLALSAASIRYVMADLEERGLLVQPHTSAGRIPSDRGYRIYVDTMANRPRVSPSDTDAIDRALVARDELPGLLEEASRQLSSLSNQVGLVVAPDLGRVIVDHLEFVRLDARRVVAILVARSGVVHNRTLRLDDEAPDQPELDRIGRYLSEEFGGRPLPEMRDLLRDSLQHERAAYDRLVRRGLELGTRALEADDLAATEMFVEGTANLLGSPELADLDVMRALFKTLEEKRTLIDLLNRVLSGDGVQVVIGGEHPLTDEARCSVVASPYAAGGRVLGSVGLIGPTRMRYAQAMALVDYLARVLSRVLTPAEN